MEVTYNWNIVGVYAKPTYVDKHGNVRTNVIKNAVLKYTGKKGEEKFSKELNVVFSLLDLTSFVDHTELTKEQLIQMCLDNAKPGSVVYTENNVKAYFTGELQNKNIELTWD